MQLFDSGIQGSPVNHVAVLDFAIDTITSKIQLNDLMCVNAM
jgi:hypothetical protein